MDNILGYSNNTPKDGLLLTTLRKDAKVSNKYIIATNLMKKSVNIGEAIVEFASHTGIAGFKFHLPKREQVKMQSEITDHYTDANNAVQDHIARKPITISLNGLQGEYFYSVNPIEDTIAQITPILSLVKQFLPRLPDKTKTFLADKYKSITGETETPEILKTGKNQKDLTGIDVFMLFQDLYKLKSAQTRAFLFFEALWKSEAYFTVETTWERYDNMAIIDLTPVRDENADITDFTVTFKQLQFAITQTTDLKNYTGRTRQELSEIASKGVDKGKKVEV